MKQRAIIHALSLALCTDALAVRQAQPARLNQPEKEVKR
jgi:hypothetical protein